ncbi:hypothetical protein DFH08DRAFT_875578, partial [Mycena albidolilacea]
MVWGRIRIEFRFHESVLWERGPALFESSFRCNARARYPGRLVFSACFDHFLNFLPAFPPSAHTRFKFLRMTATFLSASARLFFSFLGTVICGLLVLFRALPKHISRSTRVVEGGSHFLGVRMKLMRTIAALST